jgi:hypothetical protein
VKKKIKGLGQIKNGLLGFLKTPIEKTKKRPGRRQLDFA